MPKVVIKWYGVGTRGRASQYKTLLSTPPEEGDPYDNPPFVILSSTYKLLLIFVTLRPPDRIKHIGGRLFYRVEHSSIF